MTILFIRHGESHANVDTASLKEKPNHLSPLSDLGQKQAREVGTFVKDYYTNNPPKSAIRLWVSPYLRATQTAIGLLETATDIHWDVSRRGETMQFDDRLRERDTGYFEGNTPEQNREIYPIQENHFRYVMKTHGGKYYARPFNGENFADLALRIHSFLQDLYHDMDRGITEHVIVSHGNLLLAFALAITKSHPFFIEGMVAPPNTAVQLFDLDEVTQRFEDFGLVYNPKDGTYLIDKPALPLKRDLKKLLESLPR